MGSVADHQWYLGRLLLPSCEDWQAAQEGRFEGLKQILDMEVDDPSEIIDVSTDNAFGTGRGV